MQNFPKVASLSQESRQNVVMVRNVYYRAAAGLADPGMLGGTLALIQCDFGMELLMKTVLREAAGEFYEYEKWNDIKSRLAVAAKELGTGVPIDITQVTHWHMQRNSVQHLGMTIPRECAQKALVDFERTFRAIYRKVLGLEFDQLLDADVLEAGIIRDWLAEAGVQLTQKDLEPALHLVMRAYFYTILAAMERKIQDPYGPLIWLDHREIDSKTRWLWATHIRVSIREMGVPAQDFVWMSDLDSRHGPDRHVIGTSALTEDDVRKGFHVAVETALLLGTQEASHELARLYDDSDQGPPLPLTNTVVANGKNMISYGFCSSSELNAFHAWLSWKEPYNRRLSLFWHAIGGGWYQFVVGPNKITANDYLRPRN